MPISRKSVLEPFTGTLFMPDAPNRRTGVLVVPGSDGGVPEGIAERIAVHGYPSLALGYFGCTGRPPHLENIELGYFKTAIESFRESVDTLVLLGYSRGGELVLILASLFPELVEGVVALAPSSFVTGGFPYPNRPAWLLNGQPLSAFIKGLTSDREDLLESEDLAQACKDGLIPFHENTSEDPYEITDLFLARHRQDPLAPIPVERMTCPLLVISGEQDKIWPAALYARELQKRLDASQSTIPRKFLIYPHAGHGIIAPYEAPIYHPLGGFWCSLGGTPAGNQQASNEAWNHILEFINMRKIEGKMSGCQA